MVDFFAAEVCVLVLDAFVEGGEESAVNFDCFAAVVAIVMSALLRDECIRPFPDCRSPSAAAFPLVRIGVAAAAGFVLEDDIDGFTTDVDASVASVVAAAALAAFFMSARRVERERLGRGSTTKSLAE